MNKKILFLFLIICTSAFSQQGWFQQTSGTGNILYSVQFLNANTGFGCGAGGVFLKTTNAGVNWILTTTNLGALRQLQFLDASTGFVYSDSGISKTTNAGANWSRLTTNYGGNYFHFANVNTGYTVSSQGYCVKTTNGGLNWQQMGFVYAIGGINEFDYQNDSLMFAPGSDSYLSCNCSNVRISRSVNGGLNWSVQYSSPLVFFNFQTAYGLSFPDNNTGYGVGSEGTGSYFYKSTNSGITWQKTTFSSMYAVTFADVSTGWLAGPGGSIYYSTNSGNSFVTQVSGVSTTLRRIYMVNSLTGWIVGDGGTILSTVNGGVTAIQPVAGEVPKDFSLSQNYPNPFNPSTGIKFQLPSEGFAKLVVYDGIGREVTVLVNEQLKPGTYETEWDASEFPSGVYFYQLTIGNKQLTSFTETKKMVLIK